VPGHEFSSRTYCRTRTSSVCSAGRLSAPYAFYYFQIARNVAHGLGPTFDGIHRTNGFHPLWLAILTPVFGLCAGDVLPLRIVAGLAALLSSDQARSGRVGEYLGAHHAAIRVMRRILAIAICVLCFGALGSACERAYVGTADGYPLAEWYGYPGPAFGYSGPYDRFHDGSEYISNEAPGQTMLSSARPACTK
jgi:hypothetical protein